MKKGICIAAAMLLFMMTAGGTMAAEKLKNKRTLNNNMTEKYNVLPKPVNSGLEAFSKGMLYGRIRTNIFTWHWDEDSGGQNNRAFGIGGSLIYKTAPLHGISATVGMYTSQNPIEALNMDKADVGGVKAGKDTFDRNKIKENGSYAGDWGMTSLAQAYLQFNFGKTDFKLGRQIYESFLTKSNDTKMIPNTFQGISVVVKDVPKTMFTAAWFNRQKLRDHTDFHDVIAFDSWDENDDSAIHKGLSKTNLANAGIGINESELIVVGMNNKGVKNLKLETWFTFVPDLVWSGMAEANYKIPLGGKWSLTPGVRYMGQFDDGAGKIGGAALNGSLAGVTGASEGYDEADNADGSLIGGRLVVSNGPGKLHFGYTDVSDDADLITPWRGFPTGGYTRSMAQYNWEANTKSWMVKLSYNFGKAGIIPGFRTALDYTVMDYDEAKEILNGISKTDRSIIHLDAWQQFASMPGLEFKLRLAQVDADQRLFNNQDPSYYEARFEINYLF